MQRVKKSGGLGSEGDSIETQSMSCSSPYCSLDRSRRSQSVSEVYEDILNVTPRLSHQISLQKTHDRNSLCIPEKVSRHSCSNSMASTDIPKPAAELIKEIATLELEVVHLERYLLSLYRSAFDRCLSSFSTNTSPVYRSRPLESKTCINNRMDQSPSHKRTESKRDIDCGHVEDSPAHDTPVGCDISPDPSPREDHKYDARRCLADHLGASITDHVPETMSKLSEDIIKCICAIYCKLATSPSPTQQMDLLASPTPSASSSSTLSPSPPDACDSWSPRCHYEASRSPCSFGSPKDKQTPYSGMIEIPKISVDGDRFGYASKMLNIFRSLIRRLEKINPGNMDHNERLAFWINIHNALVMHAFLAYGLHQNQMKSSFSILKAAYNIGGHSVNAYVIQRMILGCQLHRPALGIRTLFSPSIKFKKGTDIHPYALEHLEPLAHFALCLGAYSDPAVRVYTAKNIHQELMIAKEEFVQSNVLVQRKNKIIMPKMLYYYARDASLEISAIMKMVSDCISEDEQKVIQGCLLQRKLDKCIEWSPYKSSFRYLVHRDVTKQ